jgi:L-iditol 2-dehydrogenase
MDAVIVTAPCDRSIGFALNAVRAGGRVLLFAHTHRGPGVPIDPASICHDEKDLIGSYSSDFTLQKEVARMVFGRRMDVRSLITHRLPLDQTCLAFELARTPEADVLKVMVSQEGGGGEGGDRVL